MKPSCVDERSSPTFPADEFEMTNIADEGLNGVDNDIFIGGNVTAAMGNTAGDVVHWETTESSWGIWIGGNVSIHRATELDFNGMDGDFETQFDDIHIGGYFCIPLSPFGDLDLDDVNVGGTTSISGTLDADEVEMAPDWGLY
jgi:hypothetical protein